MQSLSDRIAYKKHYRYNLYFNCPYGESLDRFFYQWPDLDPYHDADPVDFADLSDDELNMIEEFLMSLGLYLEVDYDFRQIRKDKPDYDDDDSAA